MARSWSVVCKGPSCRKYGSHITCPIGLNPTAIYEPKSVREITKSSSTFSATNISSNIVWLLQLHDTIKMESIFVTKFSSIYLAKGKKRLVFRLSYVNLQRAKNDTHMFGVKYRYVSVVLISSNRTLGIIPHQSLYQMNVYRVTRKCY